MPVWLLFEDPSVRVSFFWKIPNWEAFLARLSYSRRRWLVYQRTPFLRLAVLGKGLSNALRRGLWVCKLPRVFNQCVHDLEHSRAGLWGIWTMYAIFYILMCISSPIFAFRYLPTALCLTFIIFFISSFLFMPVKWLKPFLITSRKRRHL